MKRHLITMVITALMVLGTAGLVSAQTQTTYPPTPTSPPPTTTTTPPPPTADTGTSTIVPLGTVVVVLVVAGLGLVWVARRRS
jgi:hypothetical protein